MQGFGGKSVVFFVGLGVLGLRCGVRGGLGFGVRGLGLAAWVRGSGFLIRV